MRSALRALLAVLAVAAALAAAPAPVPPAEAAALERALAARDFATADRLIAPRIEAGERDPILLYNHACVLAQLGRKDEAEKRLLGAIKAGFLDFDTMEADADLEPIRGSRTYEAIMEARERVESEAAERARTRGPAASPSPRARMRVPDPVAQWKSDHPEPFDDKKGYRYERDEDSSITYATFLDESSHERMKRMLDELEAHLLRAYFTKPPTDRLLVAIVRPGDAKRYLERPEIKGMYLHSARRLVSRDTGQSLQHEFVHLMHFAHMERTGQRHPIWIQEGLASLYEDYSLRADGSIEFHPNIRFNFARKAVLAKLSCRWSELFAMDGERFMRDAEQLYPQVRAIFEYFAREGRLESFYRHLCQTSGTDPTGAAAVEKAFGAPLATVEERWKKWMTDRGAVDDTIARNDASLGIVIDDTADGVRIRSFQPKSAARAAGLRVGDVIFEVDGHPIRNRDEMLMAVARLTVGGEVLVRFRRDGADRSATVAPRPLGS